MFRRQVRRGIRAVAPASAPAGMFRTRRGDRDLLQQHGRAHAGAGRRWADKKMMRDTGFRLAKNYLTNPPLLAAAE